MAGVGGGGFLSTLLLRSSLLTGAYTMPISSTGTIPLIWIEFKCKEGELKLTEILRNMDNSF